MKLNYYYYSQIKLEIKTKIIIEIKQQHVDTNKKKMIKQ